MRTFRPLFLFLVLHAAYGADTPVAWNEWSDDVFTRARAEHRFVLLHLGAGWCHWCHVMEQTTYGDPAVAGYIGEHYLPVHVDQDSRPDISARYEDWGWPATIVFAPDGTELVKRRGYIPPERFLDLLHAIVVDPTPGPSVEPEAPLASGPELLPEARRAAIDATFRAGYDRERGGWGTVHKYLDADAIEYCLARAAEGDAECAAFARETLAKVRAALIDPAWGGLYQYSAGGDWHEPHFEKIMEVQADGLRAFAAAYRAWQDPADLAAARAIQRYLRDFLLQPGGAFACSQDADLHAGKHAGEFFALDDAHRRALGVPRIDTHRYARENGWAARGLAELHAAGGDVEALTESLGAAQWALKERALDDGAFRHGDDAAPACLADTLAMAEGLTALWRATGEEGWRTRAERALLAVPTRFGASAVGYASAQGATAGIAPRPHREENIRLARLANALWRASGDERLHAIAVRAASFVFADGVAERRPLAGALLLDRELRAAR